MAIKVSDFTGFIRKYGAELNGITNILQTVISSLPLHPNVKSQITNTINELNDASGRVIVAAQAIDKAPAVTIKKSDIVAAVNEVLPELVNKAVADALAAKDKKDA